MKKGQMKYADAENNSHGKMICKKCGKQIEKGLYLFREYSHKSEFLGYDSHFHRKCSEDHPIWKDVDVKQNQRIKEIIDRLMAYKEFHDKWNAVELDESIEDMEEAIKQAASLGKIQSQ